MQLIRKSVSISIIGCGWYGFELAKKLVTVGHKVKGSHNKSGQIAHLS